jgi:hypothetical protein
MAPIASHEVGHIYGLHERYNDTGGSPFCNSETTLMDGAIEVHDPLKSAVHCDDSVLSYDPATIDDIRAYTFYYLQPATLTYSQGVGSTYVVHFRDQNWAEADYALNFYWWNGSGWTFIEEWIVTANVGIGRPSSPLDLSYPWTRPIPGSQSGTYTACVETFNAIMGEKHWVCLPSQYLN